jgi:hypothetical protein
VSPQGIEQGACLERWALGSVVSPAEGSFAP